MRSTGALHILIAALACGGLALTAAGWCGPGAGLLLLATCVGWALLRAARLDHTRLAAESADAAVRVRELEFSLALATAERQHAEAILYSISDAVLVTGPSDDVVLANESAARTFEFDLSRATHSPIDTLLRDPKVVQLIRDTRAGGGRLGRRIVEHQVDTPTGRRTFKITLSSAPASPPARDTSGTAATSAEAQGEMPTPPADPPGGVIVVLHDVTREREVSEMKNEFVSMVSHELRTPLASIKAYVEMLIDEEAVDAKTTREFYEVIQNEANRLGRLIDNILNISRMESGLVKINKQPQGVAAVVREAIEVLGAQAERKQINIVEHLAADAYRTFADRDMLYQAVLNLLGNAVKYTPEGGTITVETNVDESTRKVVTRIADTGVGIPPKDLPFVFDKFYRAESNSRIATGTGLGLSLARHIIETVHGGRIFVESHVGRGSCFGFELDLCS